MKFGQFMSYSKRNFIKNFYINWPGNQFHSLLCLQRIKHNFYWKKKFLNYFTYIRHQSKISPNQHAGLLRFLFDKGFVENQKRAGTSFQATIFIQFFDKKFYFVMFINWPNFITRWCLLPKLFNKMCFVFHAQARDDVIKFENLKI